MRGSPFGRYRLAFLLLAGAAAALSALLPQTARARGQSYAFLVACQQYDEKELRPLRFSANDLGEFYRALLESGFPKDNVVFLHDRQQPDLLPEAKKIRKQLKLLLAGLRPDDTLVVAFAGHGVQFRGERRNYFCPRDAELTDRGSLVALDEVYRALEGCAARRKLLLVDACRNDPQSGLARSRAAVDLESVTRPQREAVPEGIVALFSCSAGQQSFEYPELKHGLFFYHVLRGWTGAADLNRDGRVTLQELTAYVEEETTKYARLKLQAVQVPQQKNDFSGTWVLRTLGGAEPGFVPLKTFTTPAPAVNPGTLGGAEAGFVPLFNGRDLTGWVVDSGSRQAWRVENGELVVRGDAADQGWLLTEQEYRDFVLRLEFRLSAGANSGVNLFARRGETYSLEVQILDDSYPDFQRNPPNTKTGALFGVVSGEPAELKPLGSWNTLEIEARGTSLRVRVNGRLVLQTGRDRFPDAVAKWPGLARTSGHLGLQNWHGGNSGAPPAVSSATVRFRNIRLKRLSSD